MARPGGSDDPLRTLTEAFAPLGILGAQLLWVAQPFVTLFGGKTARDSLVALAEALETPPNAASQATRDKPQP